MAGLFILSLSLSGCYSKYPKLVNKTIVQVNEHQLSTKDFGNQLARRLKDLDAFAAKDPQNVRQAKEQIINDFIVKSLILDWSRAQNIVVSESAVDATVDKYRANYPDDLSFRRLLAQENLSFSEWREKLRFSLIEQAAFKKINEKSASPTEPEIKKYYEDKKEMFRKKDRIYIRQIFTDDLAKAELIKTSLKNKDFASLAQQYSSAPEAKAGGLIGWVEKGSVDFFDPVFNLSIGSVSSIIHSSFGYHIVKVEKKTPASIKTLDEARPQIIRALMAQKEQGEFMAWLDRQIRSSKVLKDYDLINAINVDTRGSDD
jgi:peptidyl-prolyl cis-trans isomerase C